MTFVARTLGDPSRLARRRAAGGERRRIPISRSELVAPMDEVVRAKVAGIDYFARVLTVMSGIALVLALTGMYSLMAYLAARRTQEDRSARWPSVPRVGRSSWLTASRAGSDHARRRHRRRGAGGRCWAA